MTNYYYIIRKSDNALVSILKESKNCQEEGPCFEVTQEHLHFFRPPFTKIKWTYDAETEEFTNTGQQMTW